MKRKLFSVIVLMAILALSFGLYACNKEPPAGSISNVGNESFKGQISEQSYESAEEAAKAFLTNELDGKTSKTKFVSYEKKKDVSREEIGKLPLGDIKASDVTSAEEGTITYEMSTVGRNTYAAEGLKDALLQTVYLLTVGDTIYYCVPEARNGEMISASYYKDFWDMNHFRNSTLRGEREIKMDIRENEYQAKVSVKVVMDVKFSENAAYMKSDVIIDASGKDAEIMASTIAASLDSSNFKNKEIYIVEKDDELLYCTKVGETWTAVDSIYRSFDDFFEALNKQVENIDHTYFIKTDTGFKVDVGKTDVFVSDFNAAFGQLLGSYNLKAEYTVEKERMKSFVFELSGGVSQDNASANISATTTETYTDYGTTTVTLPEGLSEYFENLDNPTEE